MTDLNTNIPGIPTPTFRVPAAGAPAVAPNAGAQQRTAIATDANIATAEADWEAGGLDVNLEEIKLESFGAAVRAAQFNDGKLDPKEQKFIADLAHFLWPTFPHTPAGGAGPVTPPAPTPPPAPVGQTLAGTTLVQGRGFSTVGDPHETTGDGHKFDNMENGDFIKLRSEKGDFGLQTTQGNDIQGRWGKDFGIDQTPPKYATLNQRAAVKAGNVTVEYLALGKNFNYDKYPRATDGKMGAPALTINGQDVPMPKPGEVITRDNGLGGKVTITGTADGISIDSGLGGNGAPGSNDVVNIRQPKQENGKPETYINIDGQVGAARKDKEVRGSLGAFDTDTDGGNDRLPRDSNKPLATDKQLIDEWRVRKGETLFKAANPTGGAGPTKDAIDQEFDKLDKSGEGYLDGAEIPADIKAARPDLTRVPRDVFRQLREAEAKAVLKDEADFKALDKNGSGWLSGAEAAGVLRFDKGNNFTGADGKPVVEISKQEFMAGRKAERALKAAGDDPTGGAGPKPADDPQGPTERQSIAQDLKEFDKLDRNKNGQLTGKAKVAELKPFDTNNDGKITREEFLAGKAAGRADERFAKLDKDKDGKLAGPELKEKLKKYDANGDGVVDKQEFQKGRLEDTNKLRDELEFNRIDRTQDGFLTGKRTLKTYGAYDANKDGKVSKEEFLKGRLNERAAAEFKAKDKSGEGYLDGKEVSKAEKEMYDYNKDGRVTGAEFRRRQEIEEAKRQDERDFARLDRTKDGTLTGTQTYAKVKAYDANQDGQVTKDEFLKGREAEHTKKIT